MVRDAGSGTVLLLKLIVRLKLHGAAAVQPSGAVIVYRAVSEKGAGSSAKGVLLKGPSARWKPVSGASQYRRQPMATWTDIRL